jgi:phosphatidylserine synthase 2
MSFLLFSHCSRCWWDHIFLDILGCNLLGIYIGLSICNFFEIKQYPLWIGITKIKTTSGKIKRALEQFTPYNWTSYKWEIFSSFDRFIYFSIIMIGVIF